MTALDVLARIDFCRARTRAFRLSVGREATTPDSAWVFRQSGSTSPQRRFVFAAGRSSGGGAGGRMCAAMADERASVKISAQ